MLPRLIVCSSSSGRRLAWFAFRESESKIDQYEGYAFIAFYGMTHSQEGCRAHSVDIFIGTNYMVTFHDSALPVIDETATRWKENVAALGNRGPGFLLYSLLDALVDGYFPVINQTNEVFLNAIKMFDRIPELNRRAM